MSERGFVLMMLGFILAAFFAGRASICIEEWWKARRAARGGKRQ